MQSMPMPGSVIPQSVDLEVFTIVNCRGGAISVQALKSGLHVLLQVKGLDTENLIISHIQVNQAQRQRRRTYRAHGRINRESSLHSPSAALL